MLLRFYIKTKKKKARGFWGDNHLIAGLAAGLKPFSVVPTAVYLSILVEVDQIDQQFAAGGTLETLRMPTAAVSCPTRKHGYITPADLSATLEK